MTRTPNVLGLSRGELVTVEVALAEWLYRFRGENPQWDSLPEDDFQRVRYRSHAGLLLNVVAVAVDAARASERDMTAGGSDA